MPFRYNQKTESLKNDISMFFSVQMHIVPCDIEEILSAANPLMIFIEKEEEKRYAIILPEEKTQVNLMIKNLAS